VVSDWEPISGNAEGDDNGRVVDRVSLRAVVGTTDGALLRASVTGNMDDAEKLGSALAAELLDMGGLAALGEPLDREI
jgi:hydroxymethylbilane synthase